MIEVNNVVKTFDGFAALDGANITVPEGGVYGLVGPNGAGKSTIIRHLTGIYRPDSGQVLVEGQPIYENPEKKALIAGASTPISTRPGTSGSRRFSPCPSGPPSAV